MLGTSTRHSGLLPLEMYLQEGIRLVMYVRDRSCAELVELPEQSSHAFISYARAPAASADVPEPVVPLPASLKVRPWVKTKH